MKLLWAVPPKHDDADAMYVLFALQSFALILTLLFGAVWCITRGEQQQHAVYSEVNPND